MQGPINDIQPGKLMKLGQRPTMDDDTATPLVTNEVF
jgi:hypothetical protein